MWRSPASHVGPAGISVERTHSELARTSLSQSHRLLLERASRAQGNRGDGDGEATELRATGDHRSRLLRRQVSGLDVS